MHGSPEGIIRDEMFQIFTERYRVVRKYEFNIHMRLLENKRMRNFLHNQIYVPLERLFKTQRMGNISY